MAAFTGGLTVRLSNGASPEVYSTIEKVKNLSGLGKTNPLIDSTSHDSAAREYIAGLADGSELSIECLREQISPSIQDGMIAIVDSKTNRSMQIALTDGTTTYTYSMTVVPLSWNVTPSFDDAAMISFSVKISGGITVVVS